MDRKSFFDRLSPSSSRNTSPLLPLTELPPRPYTNSSPPPTHQSNRISSPQPQPRRSHNPSPNQPITPTMTRPKVTEGRSSAAASAAATTAASFARAGAMSPYRDDASPRQPLGHSRYSSPSARSPSPSLSARFNVREPSSPVLFAAPPPPIAGSLLLPGAAALHHPQHKSARSASAGGSSGRGYNGRVGHGPAPDMQASLLRAVPGGKTLGATSAGVAATSPLVALERRERALQKEMQALLDAQSHGLVEGRGGGGGGGFDDAASDAASSSSDIFSSGSRNDNLHASAHVSSSNHHHHPSHRHQYQQQQQQQHHRSGRGVTPQRQPAPKKTTLRVARRGILRSMRELERVKAAELELLEEGRRGAEAELAEVARREGKLAAFDREMRRLLADNDDVDGGGDGGGRDGRDGGGDGREEVGRRAPLDALRRKQADVAAEARGLELRLQALRARHRALGAQIAEAVNRREAELSSYRQGRKLLEKEIEDFLRLQGESRSVAASVVAGVGLEQSSGRAAASGGAAGSAADNNNNNNSNDDDDDDDDDNDVAAAAVVAGFLALPPRHRTLGLARERLAAETRLMRRRGERVRREQSALLAGAEHWRESVAAVAAFEERLGASLGASLQGGAGAARALREVHGEMEQLAAWLERGLEVAAARGWNLLVCALGAEAEALREGMEIVRGVVRGDVLWEEAANGEEKQLQEGRGIDRNGDEDVGAATDQDVTQGSDRERAENALLDEMMMGGGGDDDDRGNEVGEEKDGVKEEHNRRHDVELREEDVDAWGVGASITASSMRGGRPGSLTASMSRSATMEKKEKMMMRIGDGAEDEGKGKAGEDKNRESGTVTEDEDDDGPDPGLLVSQEDTFYSM